MCCWKERGNSQTETSIDWHRVQLTETDSCKVNAKRLLTGTGTKFRKDAYISDLHLWVLQLTCHSHGPNIIHWQLPFITKVLFPTMAKYKAAIFILCDAS